MLEAGAFGSLYFEMSPATYAVRVVCGAVVCRRSSTLIGVAAVDPSNSTHHSTKRMAGVVVLVASWSMVRVAVPVVIATGGFAPGAAPLVTPYVFSATSCYLLLGVGRVRRGCRRLDGDIQPGAVGHRETDCPFLVDP